MIYQLHLPTHDKWIRDTALVLSAIPASIFIIFAAGEMMGSDMSGIIHVVQFLFFILLLYIAFKKPYIGGLIMFFSGLVLALKYVAYTGHLPIPVMLLVISVVFIPLIAAGILFIIYGRGHQE